MPFPCLILIAMLVGIKRFITEDTALVGLLIEHMNRRLIFLAAIAFGLQACAPTVKVEAPKEPITINLNIKLDAEVRIRLEEKVQEDINNNPDLF